MIVFNLLHDSGEKLPHGGPGVNDVLHYEHILASEVVQLVQPDDVDLPRGLVVLIRLDPDEVHGDLDRSLGVVRVETVDLVQHV